jgi:hypothetical protein
MIIMKKILSTFLLLIALAVNAFPQMINVSTGVTSVGTAIPPVAPEPLWQITSSPYFPLTNATVMPFYSPFWQPSPVAGTNAGWINHTGSIFQSKPGLYTFERRFEVPPGRCSFGYDLAVTCDDVLMSIEFVDPVGNIIPLSAPSVPPAYYLDPVLGNTINSPAPGVWRLRVVVNFIDQIGGLMVSGFINANSPACFAANNNSYLQIPSDITYTAPYTTWPAKVYIAPNTTVTVSNGTLDVTNSDVVLGECARIVIGAGGNLRTNNSVFRPCCEGQTWQGITFQSNSRGQVDQCTFKQALRALNFRASPFGGTYNVRVTDNSFINCRRGISTSGGVMQEAITGNSFTIDQRPINYNPACEPSPAYNDQHFGIQGFNTRFRGLVAQNSFVNASEQGSSRGFLGVHWSRCSGVISQNTFNNMFTAVELVSCNNVSVEDNQATQTMSMRTSPANQIRTSSSSTNIWITSNKLSNTREFDTYAGDAAIYVDNSTRVNIKENEIEGFAGGIDTRDVIEASVCENKIRNTNIVGIFVKNGVDVDVACNEVNMRLRPGIAVSGIIYFRNSLVDPLMQPEFRGNCVYNTNFALAMRQLIPGGYPLPRIVNNYFYNYVNVGVWNFNFSGSIGTAIAPFSNTGHNSFVSNNIPNGALDVQSGTAINVFGNYGISSVNAGVTVLGNNLYNSSTACSHQIGTVSNELNAKENCDLFRDNIAVNLLRLQQGDLAFLRDADLRSGERYAKGMSALMHARHYEWAVADDVHALLMQDGMLTQEQAWRVHFADLMARSDFDAALHWIGEAAALSALSQDLADELAAQRIFVKLLQQGRSPSDLTTAEIEVLSALAAKEGSATDFAQDLLQGYDLGHPYRFRTVVLPEAEAESARQVVLEDEQLLLYPNPAKDKLTVRFVLPDPQGATLQVANLLGQIMLQVPLEANTQDMELQIDHLPTGVYLVSLLRPSMPPLTQRLMKH